VNILKASVVATHVIPELRRLRQRDLEFQASLGNTASPYFKKKKKRKKAAHHSAASVETASSPSSSMGTW
jgi:hypothetical protein